MTDTLNTQHIVELITSKEVDVNLTQHIVELITNNFITTEETQHIVELITSEQIGINLTQHIVELITASSNTRQAFSGLYQFVSDKKDDTLVLTDGSMLSRKIPNPFIETALILMENQ